jgi:hypothetical protein
MTSMSRRSILRGASMAALASSFGTPVAAASPALSPAGGCLACQIARMRLGTVRLGTQTHGILSRSPGDITIKRSSGDAATDHFLGLALLRLSTTFKVNPGFAFYDDKAAMNAFATDLTLAGNGPGTVLMGERLFGQLMRQGGDGGVTIIGICAHEFGHIEQMQSGYSETLSQLDDTAKPLELHADFLAGFFLALRKAEHPDLNLQTVGAVFNQLGDTDFASPQHHGTPQERIAAITAGFGFGKDGKGDVAQAAKAGLQFVKRAG